MSKGKVDDELAHPEYWDRRYETSVIKGSGAPARTATESELSSDQDRVEAENGEADQATYDWYRSWGHLEPWFKENLPPNSEHSRILHLGCGNSTLTADLHDIGYTNQTNIDFSKVVIKEMEAKYEHLRAEWKVMDVREMSFEDSSFDIAIDKATMDAMFHGSMWDPPDDVRHNIGNYLNEVERILVPGGIFLYITYRQPHFLRPLLLRDNAWSLDVRNLPDQLGGVFEYFAYVMRKHGADHKTTATDTETH